MVQQKFHGNQRSVEFKSNMNRSKWFLKRLSKPLLAVSLGNKFTFAIILVIAFEISITLPYGINI